MIFEFIGTGLVLPFNVLYLHEARHFSLSTAGLILALTPLAALITVGPVGALIDQIGARHVLLGGLTMQVIADLVLVRADTPWHAVVALTIAGAGYGALWPASQALIAAVVPGPLRSRYFAINFTLLNLGIGIGGFIGGLIVDVDNLRSMQTLYVADAISFLPSMLVVGLVLRGVAASSKPISPRVEGRYFSILRRPAMTWLVALSFLASFVGYAQFSAGLPIYARTVSQVSAADLGAAYAANTAVIVIVQLFVLRRLARHRRTRVLAAMGGIWAGAWLLLGLTGFAPGSRSATGLLIAGAVVFALGETLLQPTMPVLVNELAHPQQRGRYNALTAGSAQLAAVIAPPLSGLLLGHQLTRTYLSVLIIGSLGCAVLAVGFVERHLPSKINQAEPADKKSDGDNVNAPRR